MAWYKEWFGEEYLDLYAHRDAEEAGRHVEFVLGHLGDEQPRRVVDLACGAGRHTHELRGHGVPAIGVDLSLTLLAHAPSMPRMAGDMRNLPIASSSLDWVLNFFTSFGYFEEERANFRVLEEIVRVLAPGGRFVIDLMNVDFALANLRQTEVQERGDRRIHIRRWYEPQTRRINKRITLERAGEARRTYLESVRAYHRDEVVIGLRWAGLEVRETYGDFDGRPHDRDSERLILVGDKPR